MILVPDNGPRLYSKDVLQREAAAELKRGGGETWPAEKSEKVDAIELCLSRSLFIKLKTTTEEGIKC